MEENELVPRRGVACVFLWAFWGVGVCRSQVSDKEWVQLQGKILLNSTVAKAAIYIEGPAAGIDVLLDSLVVKHAQKTPPAPAPDFEVIINTVSE